ncbi:MAG: phosphate/phosphite/phosphonate ABC transporter substrate-binding protein [Paracoccaceae bacterium]
MIAQLAMYDWPEERAALDRLWQAMRAGFADNGIGAPETLDRPIDPVAAWTDPALLIGQTCGLPYRSRLHGHVTLLGAFDFALPDTPPGHYHSVIVARADAPGASLADFGGARAALNAFDSQSGWAALAEAAQAAGLRFSDLIVTGAHVASAKAVAEGRADIAALDAVTWRLIRAHRPATAARLRVLCRTRPTPGLPLVTAAGRDPAPLLAALASMRIPDTGALGATGFVQLPAAQYLVEPLPPAAEALSRRPARTE